MRLVAAVASVVLAAACASTQTSANAQQGTTPPAPAAPAAVTAPLKSAAGADIGTVQLTPAPKGLLLRITVNAGGLTPGWHGAHLHAVGACTDAKLQSAGGHVKHGSGQHGLLNPGGPEEGDLPNLHAASDGSANAEFFTALTTLAQLRDADGAAVILHANADDHVSQPIGGAGDRVACAVVPR
jgi:superoxide dismutase, Cu-Zn family